MRGDRRRTAGLYAAQLLARRGLGVRVLEERARVGGPVHCTGILGTEAFDLPGVPQDAVLDGVRSVVRATARFNWHRELVLGLMRHPGVLRIVLPRVLTAARGGGGRSPR